MQSYQVLFFGACKIRKELSPTKAIELDREAVKQNFQLDQCHVVGMALAIARVKVQGLVEKAKVVLVETKPKTIFIFRLQKWKKDFYGQVLNNAPARMRR